MWHCTGQLTSLSCNEKPYTCVTEFIRLKRDDQAPGPQLVSLCPLREKGIHSIEQTEAEPELELRALCSQPHPLSSEDQRFPSQFCSSVPAPVARYQWEKSNGLVYLDLHWAGPTSYGESTSDFKRPVWVNLWNSQLGLACFTAANQRARPPLLRRARGSSSPVIPTPAECGPGLGPWDGQALESPVPIKQESTHMVLPRLSAKERPAFDVLYTGWELQLCRPAVSPQQQLRRRLGKIWPCRNYPDS